MVEGDLETLAVELYERGGRDDAEPVFVPRLVRDLWHDPAGVQVVPRHALRFSPAVLAWRNGKPRIYLRAGLSPEDMNFLCGHEFAHWAMRQEGARFATEADEERAADYLGAALVAPRRSVHAALREVGEEPEALASALQSTQSLAMLRVGEVTGRPLALVRPGVVRVRGGWEWPGEDTIRRWATRSPPENVRKRPITDAPRRVALLVDDEN